MVLARCSTENPQQIPQDSSDPKLLVDAPDKRKDKPDDTSITLQEIERNGEFLGQGTYGTAYKLGDKVYKIYHSAVKVYDAKIPFDLEKGEKQVRSAERSKFYWNKVYEKIYDGKYKHLATAEIITISDTDVLITPFIDGDNAYLNDIENDEARFNKEIHKLNVEMRDAWRSDNVKKMRSTQDLLPVDFDAFYRRPACLGRIKISDKYPTYAFFTDEAPPSPGTRAWAKDAYGDSLHFNYPHPVIAPADTTLEKKEEELPAAKVSLATESKISQPLAILSQTSEVSIDQDSLETRRARAMAIITSYRNQDAWFKWFGKRRATELSGELQECKSMMELNNRIRRFINHGKTGSDYNCVWKLFSWKQSSGLNDTSLRCMLKRTFEFWV